MRKSEYKVWNFGPCLVVPRGLCNPVGAFLYPELDCFCSSVETELANRLRERHVIPAEDCTCVLSKRHHTAL